MDRKCIADYKIPQTDITIEKDTAVYIPVLGLHNDAKYFPQPEKFMPERFQETTFKNQFVFLPFGQGPRRCIGKHSLLKRY